MMKLWQLFSREKGLFGTGVVGVVLGGVATLMYLLQGDVILPEGKWSKVLTFDLAIGVFSLTLAVLLPYVIMTARQHKWFVNSWIVLSWIAYVIETVQNIRGIDPRFTQSANAIDNQISLFFAIVSMLIILCFLLFLIKAFRTTGTSHHLLVLSIRYACVSVTLAFAAGIWMIALQGRVTADAVDIMILHFVGFHGFQAIPLIGWLRESVNSSTTKLVHIAGIAWCLFCVSLFVQSVLGYTVMEFSIISIFIWAAFVGWLIVLISSVKQAMKMR